jgi:hypothetical protein
VQVVQAAQDAMVSVLTLDLVGDDIVDILRRSGVAPGATQALPPQYLARGGAAGSGTHGRHHHGHR